jgi:hypothetical protein
MEGVRQKHKYRTERELNLTKLNNDYTELLTE